MILRTALVPLALGATLSFNLGCGKVQSMLGKGDTDGGGSSSGGLLSGLGKDNGLAFLTSFEGEIGVSVKGKAAGKAGETMNLALLVKDKKFRVDLPNAPGPTGMPMKGFVVVDAPEMKAFVVTDVPEKMALTFDLNKAGEQLKGGMKPSFGGAPKESTKPPPKVTKTGKKDKVAGYECEDWEIASEENKVTVCVAQNGFSWFKIPLLGAPAEFAWAGELLDGSHFPLRAIVQEKDGKESARIEVTKIEKKALQATVFQIPPDYPQMTMEQMIAKAMAGIRMPPGAMPPGAVPPGAFPPGVAPKGAKTVKTPK